MDMSVGWIYTQLSGFILVYIYHLGSCSIDDKACAEMRRYSIVRAYFDSLWRMRRRSVSQFSYVFWLWCGVVCGEGIFWWYFIVVWQCILWSCNGREDVGLRIGFCGLSWNI
ncbi:hypothetical protein BO94DRAFT_240239 [Aspergillus sclerotioniger CBS 115572]|uniref:Transmembrane protein n=1 Tax=Aspergillus sclerotioniger CBS 115572 TaxID=1450535 RepID=A0A317VFF3_9EURO|nr:hypothetical protein BO94DRAFT_240239 [Aspergillus sclerotioniger CBS 115572]PWY73113.1 hypothetical protein BO94DRAFT_240239 [Aspergillus sclerotioniger CBS 115572]